MPPRSSAGAAAQRRRRACCLGLGSEERRTECWVEAARGPRSGAWAGEQGVRGVTVGAAPPHRHYSGVAMAYAPERDHKKTQRRLRRRRLIRYDRTFNHESLALDAALSCSETSTRCRHEAQRTAQQALATANPRKGRMVYFSFFFGRSCGTARKGEAFSARRILDPSSSGIRAGG